MPILLRNVMLNLDQPEEELIHAVARRLRVPTTAIRTHAIARRSLDARKKDIRFSYHVEVALGEPRRVERTRLARLRPNEAAWIEPAPMPSPRPGSEPLPERPTIVGFGPAGMFAALRLAQFGYKPIVLERGREVRRRSRDIWQRYYVDRDFDPSSNLLFGEGGAGAYSDGKLYSRIGDPLCRFVLETFYHHGASPEILIDARPHVGSDRLPTICTKIRGKIESLGGEVRFESKLDDIRLACAAKTGAAPSLQALRVNDDWLEAGPTILAIGHSARDTIRMLARRDVQIVPKPFQIGVRIEHPQEMVDRWQYGSAAGHQRLGPAEYRVVAKDAGGEHGDVFSFCMCPGGCILPANESPGAIVTNGASRSRRSSPFANSGLVITLEPAAAGYSLSLRGEPRASARADSHVHERSSLAEGHHAKSKGALAASALRALAFQEHWERRAFELTGRTYCVPVQRAVDFMAGRQSGGALETSYPLGGRWADIRETIPQFVAESVQRALPILEAKFPGFAGENAVIAAPETRASAPIRIVRDSSSRQAIGSAGLYPVGEGAGYAGGIVSSAVDGLKTADTIIERFAPPC